MTEPPRLRTERLLLREWHDADRAPYAALNADPAVMEHFPSTLTAQQSDEMVDRIIAKWASDGCGLWAVEVTDPVPAADHLRGRFVGFIGLAKPSWTAEFTPCVEIGWRLSRAAWGRGYAPEGARAVLACGDRRHHRHRHADPALRLSRYGICA